jgi:hypothetical protein
MDAAQQYMRQLKGLLDSQKTLGNQLKELRARKGEIEAKISEYLSRTNQPAIVYEGLTVFADEKVVRAPKKKKDKLQDAESVLADAGVSNSKELLEQILDSMKGEETTKSGVKVKSESSGKEKKPRKKKGN